MSKAKIAGASVPAQELPLAERYLPRWALRRFRQMARRQWTVPRHAGWQAMALLFVATGVTGVVAGGRFQEASNWFSGVTGLSVVQVKISGQSETSEIDILDRLKLSPDASLATLDVNAGRQRIETLPWVETATLRKVYPDTLNIQIHERKPYVLWQHGQALSVIDDTGKVIGDGFDTQYDGLLRVVGDDADKRAAEAIALAASEPSIEKRLRTAVLVGDRRWNFILDNGVTLMLPQEDPEGALKQIAAFDTEANLLSRDIVSVDLRLGTRMFVRLSPEAAAKRLADQKEQEKLAKRKGAST